MTADRAATDASLQTTSTLTKRLADLVQRAAQLASGT